MAAAVVFLGIEKTGSQVFFLSLTPLMRPYIVKITWSRPKMPCPRIGFDFCLVPSECGEEISHHGRENFISRKNVLSRHFSYKFLTVRHGLGPG
jgi:hypothetical protein